MKEYIKPNVKVVEIETTEILADSNLDNLNGGNGSDALSKGMGGFDDWDE